MRVLVLVLMLLAVGCCSHPQLASECRERASLSRALADHPDATEAQLREGLHLAGDGFDVVALEVER